MASKIGISYEKQKKENESLEKILFKSDFAFP
jgi:hypothetical protein